MFLDKTVQLYTGTRKHEQACANSSQTDDPGVEVDGVWPLLGAPRSRADSTPGSSWETLNSKGLNQANKPEVGWVGR